MLKELKMSDIIYYKNGEETFRISPPTNGTKCPETKLEVKKMTEIEKVKGEIKVLEKKLALLESIENYKSPVEKAYRDAYGKYPEPGFSAGDWDAVSWTSFQKGYDVAQKQKTGEDISKVLIEGDDAYIMGVKYQRVEEPSKPMNEVLDKLENKYKQAEDNLKPKTIRSIIDRWWTDTFTTHSNWDAEECMDDLADQIELWILRNKK